MNLKLVEFIKNNNNWEELLTKEPYYIKISRLNGFIMFKYNQIDSDFNNPIVKECRGIILNEENMKPVCVPFFKFGNYGEGYCDPIDWQSAVVSEKIDGSLMKVWNYNDEWHVSTNGNIDAYNSSFADIKYSSFGEMFNKAVLKVYNTVDEFFNSLDAKFCYMFELVSPYNRIVIPYKETELYYLSKRNMETYEETFGGNEFPKFKLPKLYDLKNLNDVIKAAEALDWDEEGYVVFDKNYHRVKIKSPKYIIAHYARNNNVITWENLIEIVINNEVEEFLTYADDYTDHINFINIKFRELEIEAKHVYDYAKRFFDLDKKTYAEIVKKLDARFQPYLFDCYSNHNLDWTEFFKSRRISVIVNTMHLKGEVKR